MSDCTHAQLIREEGPIHANDKPPIYRCQLCNEFVRVTLVPDSLGVNYDASPAAPEVMVAGSQSLLTRGNFIWARTVISELLTAIALTPGTKQNARLMEAVVDADEYLCQMEDVCKAALPTRSEAQSMPTVVEVLQRKLKSEQQRIGSGRSNQVTDLLNQLIVEVAMKEASVAVKPIVDAEIRNEEATRSLQLGSSAAGRSEAQIRANDDIRDLLVNCAQLLDTIKGEWGDEWSAWDQEQRDRITKFLMTPEDYAAYIASRKLAGDQ